MIEAKEWTRPKNADWGTGEWNNEPDKVQWADADTGLPCLIVRNMMGALCGYVGVPKGHSCYGKGYDDVDVDVHGGLTFSEHCTGHTRADWEDYHKRGLARRKSAAEEARRYPIGDSARWLRDKSEQAAIDDYDAFVGLMVSSRICHVAAPGEDNVWWLGFDCGHSGDLIPGMNAARALPGYPRIRDLPGDTYRNVEYVTLQCALLARQLAAQA